MHRLARPARKCPSLWRRLDVSPESGVAVFSQALFSAAVAKAGGALAKLDVSRINRFALPFPALLAAVTSNATSLVELRVAGRFLERHQVCAAPKSFVSICLKLYSRTDSFHRCAS